MALLDIDAQMMALALELAVQGQYTTSPNPNVGCVIALDDCIVGQGFHARAGFAHAEVFALAQAGDQARGATAYVTLEPCSHYGRTPPCADALIKAGVARVVCAMQDPNPKVAGQGLARLKAAGIEVELGLMAQEAAALNRGFIKRMLTGLPYVQLKLAASVDGRTALHNGQSKWITGSEARADVQHFRARACAILSTSQTVIDDDPALTVRWDGLPSAVQQAYPQASLRQPVRVILDTKGRVSPDAALFKLGGEIIVITANPKLRAWQPAMSVHVVAQNAQGQLDLLEVMALLGRLGVNQLWVEAGATLAASLVNAKLVDELILYQAPILLGADARPLINSAGLAQLAAAPQFTIKNVTQIGADVRIIMHPRVTSK